MTEYISKRMLEHHITSVANGRLEEDSAPDFERLEEYTELVDDLRLGLDQYCDAGPFKKGLHYLLATPGIDLVWYCESDRPYLDNEARLVLEFIWRHLYPSEPIPTTPPEGVELIGLGTSPDDWWQARHMIHRIKEGDTFMKIAADHNVALEQLREINHIRWSEYGSSDPLPPRRLVWIREEGKCHPEDEHGLTEDDLKRLGITPP
ncbi:MAG: LysM domain-containing protein [Pseudomonadota bacterium]